MDLFNRIYILHQALSQARHPVPCKILEQRLECSRATIQRTLREMRDYLGAPIDYDRARNGYRYLHSEDAPYELPGLWFNVSEIRALLAMQQLLADVQPGLLDPLLAPLRRRIEGILTLEGNRAPPTKRPRKGKPAIAPEASTQLSLFPDLSPGPEGHPIATGDPPPAIHPTANLVQRIRLVTLGARHTNSIHLAAVADALGRRRRLHIRYHGRGRDQVSERSVSPQRLTHYRDNWYLEAYCHQAESLRRFALDRINDARIEDRAAREIDPAELSAQLDSAYGIFSGTTRRWAVLLFSPERSRWVADERWHPEQRGERLEDGGYRLEVPYTDPRELVMDILRHGPEVRVLEPPELRLEVQRLLRQALTQYE